MLIVDAQIHLWQKGTPSAHHRQEPYSAVQAIAGMDAAGVDRALIHPVLWDPDFERAGGRSRALIPRPLRHHGLVLSRRPEQPRPRRALEEAAGHARPALLLPTSGTRNPGSPTARSTGCGPRPSAPGFRSHSARRCFCRPSARSPSATWPEIDRRSHGRAARAAGARPPIGFQPELLALAKYPNVAVKATGQAGYAEDAYPFRSLHPHLHRCFDAFGPERMFWGTDITRMQCSWRQCVTLFTEELPWLKGSDLDLVMGQAVCNWLGWPLPERA